MPWLARLGLWLIFLGLFAIVVGYLSQLGSGALGDSIGGAFIVLLGFVLFGLGLLGCLAAALMEYQERSRKQPKA